MTFSSWIQVHDSGSMYATTGAWPAGLRAAVLDFFSLCPRLTILCLATEFVAPFFDLTVETEC